MDISIGSEQRSVCLRHTIDAKPFSFFALALVSEHSLVNAIFPTIAIIHGVIWHELPRETTRDRARLQRYVPRVRQLVLVEDRAIFISIRAHSAGANPIAITRAVITWQVAIRLVSGGGFLSAD